MPERVVDFLELVEIEVVNREGVAPRRPRQRLTNRSMKVARLASPVSASVLARRIILSAASFFSVISVKMPSISTSRPASSRMGE